MSLQTAYNEGASISEAALDTTINITQSDTGASNYLLQISNSGGGRNLQVDNNGASYAMVLRQFGAGNCVAIGQKSTSIHNVLELENSGTGKTLYVLKSAGAGNVIDVTNSGSGTDLKITHTNSASTYCIDVASSSSNDMVHLTNNGSHASAGSLVIDHNNMSASAIYIDSDNTSTTYADVVLNHQSSVSGSVVTINNSSTGTDLVITHANTDSGESIRINNAGGGWHISGGANPIDFQWGVNSAGYATFNNVNVGCGKVYASNTPIAGGRVHVYQREGGEVGADLWCDWGISTATWESVSYLPSPALHVVRLIFEASIQCPIVKVTPWPAGQYDETQSGMFNYIAEGHTNVPLIPVTAIEPHIAQLIPISINTAMGVDLYFQYCQFGDPATQAPYEVYLDQEVGHDLVFDFEILGCAGAPV